MNVPFFIVGCVRSGTTLMRTILRTHPRLCCPEETQFFRWGDPFATEMFDKYYLEIANDLEGKEPVYKLHRRMDGVSEEEFLGLLEECDTRADLLDRYCRLFMAKNGMEGRRWFDKSPQNIYGILMLNAFYPDAKFVHLVRNPLDVVASMKVGEVIQASVKGACNYWLEAVETFEQFRAAHPRQCIEVKFEDFIGSTPEITATVLRFLGEDPSLVGYAFSGIRKSWRNFHSVLSESDVALVQRICGPAMSRYGYGCPT